MARKSKLTRFILERLEELKEAGAEFSYVFLENPFETYSRARQAMLGNFHSQQIKTKHNLYNLFYYLKKQGLIEKNTGKNRAIWRITESGRAKLKELKKQNKSSLPSIINYQTKEEKNLKLVIFDIPEKYKHKREWLRGQLIALDYEMLQKSVWMGKSKLPEEFIRNLNDLDLLSYTHILTIKNEGTIKLKL